MQQLASRPRPDQPVNTGGAPRSQVALIVALLLFSVAGLVSGLSVGAFTRTKPTGTTGTTSTLSVQPQSKQTPITQTTKTVNVLVNGIGCPTITPSSYTLTADNTTTYTIEAQAIDKSIEKKTGCGKGKALQASGITFKIWITKDLDSLKTLQATSTKLLTDVKNLQQAFPHEKGNILLLNGSSQIQASNAQGAVTWKYSIASGTDPGSYYIAILTDWQGKGWNWSWIIVNITKAN